MKMEVRFPIESTPGALEVTGDWVTLQLLMNIFLGRFLSSVLLLVVLNFLRNRFLRTSLPSLSSECPVLSLQIRQLYCGSTYTLFLSKTNNFYFNGILPNSPRKEACTYPRIQQELYDWNTNLLSGGSSWILIGADSSAIYWGVPVAGTFGLENGLKRSAVPVMVSAVSDMRVLDISSGYCHSCMVVAPPTEEATSETDAVNFQTKLETFPLLPTEERGNEEIETGGKGGKGKKRGAPAAAASAAKKGKKK
jgi:hypothetical protein